MTITYQTDAERAQTEVIRAVRVGRDILARRVEELEAENARLRAASNAVLFHVKGTLPVGGWLLDSDKSRIALDVLRRTVEAAILAKE
jgi:hypothetical protein